MGFSDIIPEWAKREVEELIRAPTGVLIVLLIGLCSGWLLAGMFYEERFSNMELLVANAEVLAGRAPEPMPRLPSRTVLISVGVGFLVVLIGAGFLSHRRYRARLVAPAPFLPAAEVIYGRTYRNEVVDIDGKTFVECTFENVTWRFSGNAAYEFKNVHPVGNNMFKAESPAIALYMGTLESLKLSDFVEHVDAVEMLPDGSHKRISRTRKDPRQGS
jgi:hypothetical protein